MFRRCKLTVNYSLMSYLKKYIYLEPGGTLRQIKLFAYKHKTQTILILINVSLLWEVETSKACFFQLGSYYVRPTRERWKEIFIFNRGNPRR